MYTAGQQGGKTQVGHQRFKVHIRCDTFLLRGKDAQSEKKDLGKEGQRVRQINWTGEGERVGGQG
jgi:hypothetical protein